MMVLNNEGENLSVPEGELNFSGNTHLFDNYNKLEFFILLLKKPSF